MVDQLEAQKLTIDAVVRAVRQAEAAGEDPIAALRQLAQARPAAREEVARLMSQRMLARHLIGSPRWKEELGELEQLQLPHFHR